MVTDGGVCQGVRLLRASFCCKWYISIVLCTEHHSACLYHYYYLLINMYAFIIEHHSADFLIKPYTKINKECFDCVVSFFLLPYFLIFLLLDNNTNTQGSRLKLCFYYKRKVLNTQEEIQICYTLYMPPLWCYWYKSQNKLGPSFAV